MLKKVTFVIPEWLVRKFKSVVALEGKTMSEVLAEIIEHYVKQYEEEKEKKEVKA